jgi:hypothetical protein
MDALEKTDRELMKSILKKSGELGLLEFPFRRIMVVLVSRLLLNACG